MGEGLARGRSTALGWLTIVAGLVVALAVLLGGQAVFPSLPLPASPAGQAATFYVVLFAPLVVLSLALGRLERRPVLRAGQLPARWGALGLAAGAAGLALCVTFVWLHGTLRAAPASGDPAAGLLALGLAIAVLQVLAEELLFRGWLLPALAARLRLWAAVFLSSAAFAGFHLIGGAAAPLSLVNLMLGGIWFALLALRSGGILAPVAAHYGWNVAEDLGLGLIPNPGRGEFGAVLDRDMVGPTLWGGGEEGLNASIAMTLVLVAMILPLLAPRSARRA